MRLLFAAIVSFSLIACDPGGDANDAVTAAPTGAVGTPSIARPTSSPPQATATSTGAGTPTRVVPPANSPPQTTGGCPVDDAALCDLALELREAVASGDLTAIEARLIAVEHPCAGTFTRADENIGCDSADDTSEPVVEYFAYGTDCCYVVPGRFAHFLAVALGPPVDDTWRIWGIIEGSPFWDGQPSVLLIRGVPDDRQVIEFGTTRTGDGIGIPGMIRGTVLSLYIFPGATLKPWR